MLSSNYDSIPSISRSQKQVGPSNMIDEKFLTLGAVLFELGVPVVAIVALVRAPQLRRYAAVVLGAVTPFLLAYGYVTILYFLDPANKDYAFSVRAMWMMSFLAYLLLVVGALIFALVPKPSNLYARFVIGFIAAPFSYALFTLAA